MADKIINAPPSNVLQFRTPQMSAEEHKRIRQYYFGGCGPNQDFWPKRHRWGPWEVRRVKATGSIYRERMCRICALVSDSERKCADCDHYGDAESFDCDDRCGACAQGPTP